MNQRRKKISSIPGVCSDSGPEIVEIAVFAVAVSGWQTEAGSFLAWAGSAAGGSPSYQHTATSFPKGLPHPSVALDERMK